MKKFISWMLIFGLSICVLSGCDFNNGKEKKLDCCVKDILKSLFSEENEDEDYVIVTYADVDKEAKNVTEKISNGILKSDVEEIKKNFSKYARDNYDLANELQQLLKKMDGKIVNIEKLESGSEGGETDEDKGWVYNYYYGRLDSIKTDTGKEYSILIKGIYNYEGSKDKEGINEIWLMKVNDDGTEEDIMNIGELAEYKEE